MDIFIQYSIAIGMLIVLEILLSVDNAAVLAVMVKHLPEKQQKKALSYGIWGAVILRFASFFFISTLMVYWQIQAIGAVYLLFLGGKHLYKHLILKKKDDDEERVKEGKKAGFWSTVLKVEVMDIVFAVDSILAAIAIAVTLPTLGYFELGGLDVGQFAVIMIGGIAGLVAIRFVAVQLVAIMKKRPGLETAAYGLVFMVGIKLTFVTLSHDSIHILSHGFVHGAPFQLVFWSIMLSIIAAGWFLGNSDESKTA